MRSLLLFLYMPMLYIYDIGYHFIDYHYSGQVISGYVYIN